MNLIRASVLILAAVATVVFLLSEDGHDPVAATNGTETLRILDPLTGSSHPIGLDPATLEYASPESILPSGRVLQVIDNDWGTWVVDLKTGEAFDAGLVGASFVYEAPRE